MKKIKYSFILSIVSISIFSSTCFAVGTTYKGIFQTSATTGENLFKIRYLIAIPMMASVQELGLMESMIKMETILYL